MSKLNLLIHLNAFKDLVPTNNPTKSLFRWTQDSQANTLNDPQSKHVTLKAGETMDLFQGVVAIADDATTTYDISFRQDTGNTYRISHNSGTAPTFRDKRNLAIDATTEISVTKNGPILKVESVGGTALDTSSLNVGDLVRIGALFLAANQGTFKVLSVGTNSFQIENNSSVSESSVVLGANFNEALLAFSSDGVQKGDNLTINSGFSPASFGNYEITEVTPDYIDIYSIQSLPEETNISTQLFITNNTKTFIYIETDKNLSLTIDGNSAGNIEPLVCGTRIGKGSYLKTGSTFSASITNNSQQTANIFFATGE